MGTRYIIERHGGVAGVKASCTIDADSLTPADRLALEQLLDEAESPGRDLGADRYTYVVTRQAAPISTRREIPESQLPDAIARAVTTEI